MWSVGNKSKFIPATTDAKRGLEKGLERATAAIARAPSHDWKPKAPDANLKSQWIVDAPRAGASDRDGVSGASGGIGAHLELEQMVSAGRRPAAASVGAGGERDSSDYASSSDESRSASRRRRKKKRRRHESSASSGDSSDEDRDARARKRSRKKDAKGKKSKRSKKEKKSRKGKRRRRSASDASSDASDDSDADDRKVSAVSGERIKMKLEGTSRRDEADERRRQAYLRQLNATVDLARVSNAG